MHKSHGTSYEYRKPNQLKHQRRRFDFRISGTVSKTAPKMITADPI